MVEELKPERLYRRCDPESLPFKTTEELEELDGGMGQPRAVEAVRFGIGIERPGYNIYALGPPGTGKHALVRHFLQARAAERPAPSDWVYVHDFAHPNRPRAIELPPGMGTRLRRDMEQLVEELRPALSSAFEGEEYQARRRAIEEEFAERSNRAFAELRRRAQERGLALLQTPMGWVFAPLRDGQVLSPQELQQLPEEERTRLEREVEELQQELQRVLSQDIPRWQREMQRKLRELNREVTNFAVGSRIEELKEEYAEFEEVAEYLEEVRRDIVQNAREFLGQDRDVQEPGREERTQPPPSRRYQVNVLVDRGGMDRAPVIYEDNPTYQNLLGRVEYMAQMGALVTDFNLIRPGALHRANGGYLILDARRLLMQPFAWEGLKRALRSRLLRIESPGQMVGLISTISLEPEPIPLDVKVVLLGDRLLYYLLSALDPEFVQLFKVAADFDEEVDRDGENDLLYARLIGTIARREGLRPFDRTGVARVIEHGSRLAGDSGKLSIHVESLADVLREADYWASRNGNGAVTAADVQRAIDARTYRSDRLRERVQEQILRGTLLIDTEGERVGQVNGLSVIELGGFAFGRPSRISARVRMGRGEVVDIEREVKLSGPIHSKGVLILAGFLGGRYASERPLSLSASLVFEQSYSGVEGDSASSAELYALLSAISGVPLKQSLAVTGSVNQHGDVQAIGGVNEKIEGFFDICRRRGLTGEQGVVIPRSNVQHLMLRRDVVEAVERGEFHIYPVRTVDEGMELLTGLPAGEPDEEGRFPEDTVNGMVERRLAELGEKMRALAARSSGEDGNG
ncbi:ATP-dependent protease, putative [Rubrobacter xylanophilus DSM 9941]|uniref:endopeptidase La n=1 Tax=Rubrobacter xylanophilus (strain DSM 9941 / JCM 11954 / NBRC 16129 / PRD-1) TaxID=266117 RepID=Q1AUQ2_RUBXD|nr:ATP-binding protein [Rubrobacter xylanophilus]ABG04876.1 ATP-dependent protease, putative [Rubrobacter xylanophilus DSM 9941]